MTSTAPVEVPPELSVLTNLVEEKPECFASGSRDICAAALNATKFVFDISIRSEFDSRPHITELLSALTSWHAPQTRSQARASGKRKRSPSPPAVPKVVFETTPLTSLFLQDMNDDQIWAQLDLKTKHVCDILELALEGEAGGDDDENSDLEDNENPAEGRLKKALQALEDDEEAILDGMDLDGDDGQDGNTFLDEDDSEEEQDELSELADTEGVLQLRNSSSDDDSVDNDHPLDTIPKRTPSSRRQNGVPRHAELDDGFFDLASFNAETEQAEARSSSAGRLGGEDDSDEDDMSVDLFSSLDHIPNFDEEDLEKDPGEARYRDFFEPPLRKPPIKSKSRLGTHLVPKKSGQVRFHEEVRVKKIRANGKKLPMSTTDHIDDGDGGTRNRLLEKDIVYMNSDEDEAVIDGHDPELVESEDAGDDPGGQEVYEDQGREVIERLKDDLFAEEDGSQPDLSTHEKRLATLHEQIAELESENVGPKDWVLMGEAGSRTRPQNSLLEEDLEFERVMKAVPVITEEIVQGLEERIKARILEGRFDDVIRIRPMDDKPFLPSRFFELKDTKSTQSLAQIYEDGFIAATTGSVAGDDRDGKLKKEHLDIEQLWESISSKLDALCNAHFIPKQPKATISTISNVSTTTLESALPITKSAATMLAPEEVFTPSSADSRARSELTPVEKRALHAKERKAKKKSRDVLNNSVDKYAKMRGIGGVKKQKQAALDSVVKSGRGVTVIGKRNKGTFAKSGRKARTE